MFVISVVLAMGSRFMNERMEGVEDIIPSRVSSLDLVQTSGSRHRLDGVLLGGSRSCEGCIIS
jgi:hypothetical protein